MRITIDNLENAITFTLIFQHIKSFTDFVNLSFHEDKLYIQAMDTSKISVFEVNLMKSFFSTYDFEENELIGVNVNLLFKILNVRDKKQKLELSVENGDKLNIDFTSDDVSIMNKSLQISLVEIEEEVFEIPEMEYNVSIVMSSTRFTEIINDVKLFDDTIIMNCTDDTVLFTSESSDTGKIKVEMNETNMKEYTKNDDDVNVSYALKLLSYATLYNKITDEVKIDISEGVPLKITYILENSNSKLNMYLAPKING
tara:strand:+ start:112 stop:879 length:768 start_codon:yes stop_codon:yes gene_type:complete